MGTLHGVVMLSPLCVLRPHRLRREGTLQALVVHHIRHTTLAVELITTILQSEILLHWQCPVRTMTTDYIIRRAGDIMNARMILLHDATQCLVDLLGREALVTSAIDTDRGMVAETLHIIGRIGDKHLGIVGIRTVSRVSQPEVLPNHDTMTVARLIQLLITNLTYPVTHHREVHIRMIIHGNVILTTSVVQVRLTKAPVTTTTDETTAIDEEAQDAVVLVESHLTDTHLEVFRIRYLISHLEGEIRIIQVRITITLRPPEMRILHLQLGELLRIKLHSLLLVCLQLHRLLKRNLTDLTTQYTRYWR